MLGDSKKRIKALEEKLERQSNMVIQLGMNVSALKREIENIKNLPQATPIMTEKKDPSAKLRNKDGLLDSRIYFSKKMKEDEE